MPKLFRNPLTDSIMEDEMRIKKIGHRVRILNKLKVGKIIFTIDSKQYLEKCKGTFLHVFDKKHEVSEPCKCVTF